MIRNGPDRTIGGTGIWIFVGGKLYLREKTIPYGTAILEFVFFEAQVPTCASLVPDNGLMSSFLFNINVLRLRI